MKNPSIVGLFYRQVFEMVNLCRERFILTSRLMLVYIVVNLLLGIFSIAALVLSFEVHRSLMTLMYATAVGLIVGLTGMLVLVGRESRSKKPRRHQSFLLAVSNFADFWGLDLRKRIKACAGEFDVEVKRLHKEKRYRMAKWNVALAWGYAIWYVLRGPYDMLKGALVKALKGL